MKNRKTLLVGDQLTLAINILLNHFVKDSPAVLFFIRLLIGLSVVFNITYPLKRQKEKSTPDQLSLKAYCPWLPVF